MDQHDTELQLTPREQFLQRRSSSTGPVELMGMNDSPLNVRSTSRPLVTADGTFIDANMSISALAHPDDVNGGIVRLDGLPKPMLCRTPQSPSTTLVTRNAITPMSNIGGRDPTSPDPAMAIMDVTLSPFKPPTVVQRRYTPDDITDPHNSGTETAVTPLSPNGSQFPVPNPTHRVA